MSSYSRVHPHRDDAIVVALVSHALRTKGHELLELIVERLPFPLAHFVIAPLAIANCLFLQSTPTTLHPLTPVVGTLVVLVDRRPKPFRLRILDAATHRVDHLSMRDGQEKHACGKLRHILNGELRQWETLETALVEDEMGETQVGFPDRLKNGAEPLFVAHHGDVDVVVRLAREVVPHEAASDPNGAIVLLELLENDIHLWAAWPRVLFLEVLQRV
mmetsp:Transcript_2808/g.8454  ORF Transcript_2808/g.8454 Transcript_2808/m.8454 type:complete len:217 (-) Transcript_2808:340-990(-)